ncbi:NrsF family protein [soil metagenome]
MKTDNLIEALIADHMPGGKPMRLALLGALAVGGLVSLGVFFLDLGVRTDIADALRTWRFDIKVALVFVALLLAFSLCLALSRPVISGHPGRRLLPLAALAVAMVAIELAALPSTVWAHRMVGSNALICLAAIPMLAIAPLAAVLMVLRSGAPASPMLAGAAAGLLAATAGAALYAFHCFDDSPLFVVTWYTLAAAPVVLLGAVAGHRLLRW